MAKPPRKRHHRQLTLVGDESPAAEPRTARRTASAGSQEPGPDHSESLAELMQELVDAGAPPAILEILEKSDSPDEVVQRLIDEGVLPGPDETMAELVTLFEPLLARDANPLEAELAGSEFVGMLRPHARDPEELQDMLLTLVALLEEHGGAIVLVILRAFAVTAPDRVRPVAAAAAERLHALGLADPPWVAELGTPQLVGSWGYRDLFGSQEMVGVTFQYGRKRHIVSVLIDHDLGGGVKDIWLSDKPQRVRTAHMKSARSHDIELDDYEPAQARAILDRALSMPPCPVQPDQVEDVNSFLDLLRRRTALLGVSETRPAKRGAPTALASASKQVHRLKVRLSGSRPPIWRRLEVPSEITLAALHDCIQLAFGWQNYHMWVFETNSGLYGVADPDLDHADATRKRLSAIAPRVGDRFSYIYDFGDDWLHETVVEAVSAAESGVAYPRCTGGRRACPPEDCGGIWGYGYLLAILSDPKHEEHRERLAWLGLQSADQFDPAEFDLDEANRSVSALAKILVKSPR